MLVVCSPSLRQEGERGVLARAGTGGGGSLLSLHSEGPGLPGRCSRVTAGREQGGHEADGKWRQ